MKPEELREFYLAKMKEAEELAAGTKDQGFKVRWLAIAEGYRILSNGKLGPGRR